jgi:hypothetical protein
MPLHHRLGHLSGTQNAIQSGGTTIRAAQHRRVDRLRTQTAHLDAVITMGNRQRLGKADRRMLGGGVGRGIGLVSRPAAETVCKK